MYQPSILGGPWLLGVQSRSEVGWIVSESAGLVCPSFADVLVGSEPPQGLEALGEVVGVDECLDVLAKLVVAVVVVAPNSRLFETLGANRTRRDSGNDVNGSRTAAGAVMLPSPSKPRNCSA
jgi:hypothetical protein